MDKPPEVVAPSRYPLLCCPYCLGEVHHHVTTLGYVDDHPYALMVPTKSRVPPKCRRASVPLFTLCVSRDFCFCFPEGTRRWQRHGSVGCEFLLLLAFSTFLLSRRDRVSRMHANPLPSFWRFHHAPVPLATPPSSRPPCLALERCCRCRSTTRRC